MKLLTRYRKDYDGEFIVTKTIFRDGQKIQEREWIPNTVTNHHTSGRAACIGSLAEVDQFDLKLIENHKGGLLGVKRLQTYTTGDTVGFMKYDFVVSQKEHELLKLKGSYSANNIVYTTPNFCLKHPGRFYMIPHSPQIGDMAAAAYLAAFDAHDEIFLIGYSNDSPDLVNLIPEMKQIFRTFRSAKFYLIGAESNMPTEWLEMANVNVLKYRDFVTHCDV